MTFVVEQREMEPVTQRKSFIWLGMQIYSTFENGQSLVYVISMQF